MIKFFKLVLTVLALATPALCQEGLLVWGFECRFSKCVKVLLEGNPNAQGQTMCRMLCGEDIGTLWPKPRGTLKKGNSTVQIDRTKIKFQTPSSIDIERLWRLIKVRFLGQIGNKIPEPSLLPHGGRVLKIKINVKEAPKPGKMPRLTYETDESYSLRITNSDEQVLAEINGTTFFGARHGLESLSQLIVYDEIGESLQIITDTEIKDAPAYKHRGVILDTARNYFSVKSIKRTINGMAMSKMNVLQWHLTDSTSFPLVIRSRPDFHNIGAYSARKIYTRADIVDIVEYARARGVRVIPEFDAPAHVGEGWQYTKFITCFNAQPWKKFCKEPPCGQLDPTIDELYDVLEDIYREIFEAFDPDIFHMGSDTVGFTCWNNSESIQSWMLAKGWKLDDDGFVRLWGYFQAQALARVDKVAKDKEVSIILHGNRLSDSAYVDEFIDKSRYIVQIFGDKFDGRIEALLHRGIRLIPSASDLIIDSQTAVWTGYYERISGWQSFYQSRPEKLTDGPNRLILGSAAAVYSEQIDEFSLDTLLWPKASALAERLWTNPSDDWQRAESRFSMHRTHLTENGILAAALQPEWCFLNIDDCPKDELYIPPFIANIKI